VPWGYDAHMTLFDHVPALTDLSRYWSADYLGANVFIGMHLVGALLLGMVLGYERTFRGRAAGMRTYGLVCMTSAGLTVLAGLPHYWYGGGTGLISEDPTRIIQGIVTGIGFLGAGVIMRDGFHVSGLSTSASIWTSSAIGVLVGVGFYGAAILLAVVCALSMEWVRRLERFLPAHTAMAITLNFEGDGHPSGEQVSAWMAARGFELMADTLIISVKGPTEEWRFNASALQLTPQPSPAVLARLLGDLPGLQGFTVAPHKS
jgi:putative Mg2+ transporter-C (MgtC) family protein